MTLKTVLGSIPWVVIGRIIGIILIIPVGNYLLNRFYYGGSKYNDENEVEQYYQQYIDNSDTLVLTMPKYGSEYYLYPNVGGSAGLKTISFKIRRNKGYMNESIHVPTISFYSLEYKKYFTLMYFGYYVGRHEWGGKEVIITVNKDDTQNPEYGTKENPIPVLKAIGVKESIRPDNEDYDTTYMNEFYKNNVMRYLRYKISKEEFNKRFKNKN
ncbi:hypothetical protein AGMMS50239_07060 [Bacteroidia bacterium]|nr:hypothetical protein AGMMS50239_07060 [Bacteroidia bacterium]